MSAQATPAERAGLVYRRTPAGALRCTTHGRTLRPHDDRLRCPFNRCHTEVPA